MTISLKIQGIRLLLKRRHLLSGTIKPHRTLNKTYFSWVLEFILLQNNDFWTSVQTNVINSSFLFKSHLNVQIDRSVHWFNVWHADMNRCYLLLENSSVVEQTFYEKCLKTFSVSFSHKKRFYFLWFLKLKKRTNPARTSLLLGSFYMDHAHAQLYAVHVQHLTLLPW